jgi:DNA-binding response OmpR family regulator
MMMGGDSALQAITVLNVNDRLASRYTMSKMLRNAGYEVIEAETGEEALRMARERRPHVVLLDIQLPDIDGLEVCRRLKTDPATQEISIVQTSATYNTVDMKVKGLEVGADGYLMQPFGSQELVATVNSIVRIRRTEVEQRRRAEALAEADR